MDDHTLSLRLYNILDWIGASEEMRGKNRENAIVKEIVSIMVSTFFDESIRIYMLGSNGEGTTTTGLNSDLDILCWCVEPVVEIISDASQHGLSFLILIDDSIKPGYCKLQAVLNQVPSYDPETPTKYLCVPDQYDKICLHHLNRVNDVFTERNGPAITSKGVVGRVDKDIVFAFRCQKIPSFAKSWVTRVTSFNRQNETLTQTMKEFGCFFVGKNHPLSQNGPIEWRLSFSLQERELMSRLNPTQHKSYILLKMIRKDIIHKRVPKSISSYHCKTCLLYAIEKTPCEFWTRRNLLECVLVCVRLLLHWVKEEHCPNYFIPEENMFDRIDQRTLQQVQPVLEDMVEHWCMFIWSIACDDLCNVLFGSAPNIMMIHHKVSRKALEFYIDIILSNRQHELFSLNQCNSISGRNSIVVLHQMQTHILLNDCVRDHTEKETRHAIRYFIPYLRLQTAQYIASIMLSTIDTHRLWMLFDRFKYYIEESKNCDAISAYLIIASYCLQSDRNDICENILLQCEKSLKSHVLSICGCHHSMLIVRNETVNELEQMLSSQYIPYTEFARTFTTGCLVFLPHQANIVPSALHYEMYRSVYTPPDSRDEKTYFWFDWIGVDSKVYLYFMQYVLYSQTNKPVYKQDAVDNLLDVAITDKHLGHEETAWNLLGWIFKKENKIKRAIECFVISWRIRPFHNAAKWHMIELVHSID